MCRFALKEYLEPSAIAVVRGPADAFVAWRKLLSEPYLPHALILFVPNGVSGLPATLAKNPPLEVNAWVCRGVTSFQPVNMPEALIELCKGTKDH